MRSLITGFIAGIIVLQQQARLMQWTSLAGLLFLAILVLCLRHRMRFQRLSPFALFMSGALTGWCYASVFALIGLSHQLPLQLEEKDITVIGVIANLPVELPVGHRFQFEIENVVNGDIDRNSLPRKVLLSWYEQGDQPNILQPGERWRLNVRLRRPHGLANPEGFDYEVWLLEQGIGATGSVRAGNDKSSQISAGHLAANQRLSPFVFTIRNSIEWARGQLRQKILNALPNQPYAPIIVALVIGEQNGIAQNDWKIFARTGVNHLIAISGLHISLIAGLAASLMFYLWSRSFFTRYDLPLLLPAQKAAAWSGVVVALCYVALAGFGLPAQRTLIMITVTALGSVFDRHTRLSNILFVALGSVLVFDPWAVLSPGFWLSFSAVGMIYYASIGRSQPRRANQPDPAVPAASHRVGLCQTAVQAGLARIRHIRQASVTQYAITLGLIPLTLLFFDQISIISPIANAIAIPVVSLLVTPLSLSGSLLPDPAGGLILAAAHFILQHLVDLLSTLNQLPCAVWQARRPDAGPLVGALLGTAWCLAPKGWPLRWAGLLTWLPICLSGSTYPDPGDLKVTALDVGQGMALLVETPHHRLLYDTGPLYSANSDAGSRVIYPYLHSRGIYRLDGMIVSHNDSDHSGGAVSLLQQLDVNWVLSSLSSDSTIVTEASRLSHHSTCIAGQQWEWDGIRFEILYPAQDIYDNNKARPNAKSCTLKISNGPHSMLLAGDIEAAQEKTLVRTLADKLASTVLLAPHHGSGTSSTEHFLTTVQPRFAIFQLGYHNRYHHPKADVWQRYADLGIQRFRSDQAGTITINLGKTVTIDQYRESHRRYWYPHEDMQ